MIIRDWGHDGLNELQQGINRMLFELNELQAMMERLQATMKNCKHVSDGMIYTSNPPQNKCVKCREFYR